MICYMDNSATTKVMDEVIEEMNECMREEYANPSSRHFMGVNAEKQTLKKTISIPMIPAAAQLKIYADDEQLNGSVNNVKLNKKQQIEISIPNNGALVILN